MPITDLLSVVIVMPLSALRLLAFWSAAHIALACVLLSAANSRNSKACSPPLSSRYAPNILVTSALNPWKLIAFMLVLLLLFNPLLWVMLEEIKAVVCQ